MADQRQVLKVATIPITVIPIIVHNPVNQIKETNEYYREHKIIPR